MNRTFKIKNSEVEITFEKDENKIKRNLINVYDVINKIADNCEKRGIDTSSWFIKAEQLEKMKRDSNYNFL